MTLWVVWVICRTKGSDSDSFRVIRILSFTTFGHLAAQRVFCGAVSITSPPLWLFLVPQPHRPTHTSILSLTTLNPDSSTVRQTHSETSSSGNKEQLNLEASSRKDDLTTTSPDYIPIGVEQHSLPATRPVHTDSAKVKTYIPSFTCRCSLHCTTHPTHSRSLCQRHTRLSQSCKTGRNRTKRPKLFADFFGGSSACLSQLPPSICARHTQHKLALSVVEPYSARSAIRLFPASPTFLIWIQAPKTVHLLRSSGIIREHASGFRNGLPLCSGGP